MKVLSGLIIVTMFIFLSVSACSEKKDESKKSDSTVNNNNNNSFPEGYPQELVLPEGISVNDIQTGTGRVPTPGGVNDKIYNVYVIYKKHPQNYKNIIIHYKNLITKENHWQGNWESHNPNQLIGTFKKDNIHLALEINKNYFSLKIEVYDNVISAKYPNDNQCNLL